MAPTVNMGTFLLRMAFGARAALAWALAFATLAMTAPVRAESAKIALTFDDLPALSMIDDQAQMNYITEALLRGLVRHRFRATGFVNEVNLDIMDRDQQIANLDKWLGAGMGLGNHTYSHEAASALGATAYIEDIQRGERVTKWLLARHGKRMRWFRHPYLDTGSPAPVKKQIDTWLAAHFYRIAPVTIDADDWEWASPYDDAIAHNDEARRLRLKQGYLAYTEKTIDWERGVARMLFGRDISYVMLLHATRLNADCIDDLAAMLRREHLHVVSLNAAMRDPAYRTPDTWTGKDGIDWLVRWARAQNKPLPWSSLEPIPAWVQAEYDRLEDDRLPKPAEPAAAATTAK
jgi:peptidoglycan/xylan/chitin deacetylase (PgdA/CDA1 family)